MGNYDFDSDYVFDGYGGPLSWTAQHPFEDCFLPPDLSDLGGIPDKFDLTDKDQHGASPVKDKGRTPEGIGICWLFAAIASLESNLLYTGKASEADQLYIQSELHGAYATFDLSDGTGDKEYENPRGRKPGVKKDTGKPAYGGSRYMAVNYLTRDVGTTPQPLDPYYKEDMVGQVLKKRRWDLTSHKPGKYYVKKVLYLPEPVSPGNDPNYLLLVKSYVMQYGGVSCSILWESDDQGNDTYLKKVGDEYTYYDNTSGDNANHAVTIMGWDDGYPVDNFKYTPKNPGAFLVKNCWGDAPAGGYFWVSYECANFGGRAYCVADVTEEYYNDTVKIYQHDIYGYNDWYVPYSDGNSKFAMARNTFDIALSPDSEDQLIGVSFYACSSCYVTLLYSEGSQGDGDIIVENYACPAPGYYTYELKKPIDIFESRFSITVKYKSATNLPAYIPLEVNSSDKIFVHWDIDGSKSSVFRRSDGKWVPVSDLKGPTSNSKYGYFCMKAIVKNVSDDAETVKKIYNDLALPALHDGYTEILPDKKDGIALEWRLEPYQSSEYSQTYQSSISMYETETAGKKSYGLVNTGTQEASAYLVATISGKDNCMRKIFSVALGAISEQYSFDCGEVKQGDNKSTIQGTFSVPGAEVSVKSNDQTGTAIVKQDGTWVLENFSLYADIPGWKDEFADTTVTVEIKSPAGLTLTRGKTSVKLENPAKKEKDGWSVWTFVGLVTAAMALAVTGIAGVIYLCGDITVPGGLPACLNNIRMRLFGRGRGRGERRYLRLNNARINEIGGAENLHVEHLHINSWADIGEPTDQLGGKTAENQQWGGIARKIAKGGSIINCTVTGSVGGDGDLGQFGGLFYEGEDVTVQNCTVDLEVGGSGTFAGVAVNLSGSNSSITDTTVTGTVKADKVAGLVQTMEGGRVERSGVSLDAQAQTSFAGLLETGADVEISDTVVSATGSVSSGKAAGGILSMNGGSIKNCRISAILSGSAGAFGIAGAMGSGAKIENCYSACRLTATEADAAVCGIAEGIKDTPGSISGCVSVGSHFSAPRAARVSLYPGENCVAYDSMTCDGSFISAGEILKPCSEFWAKSLYEALGWDFTVWSMEDKQGFPLIQGGKVAQAYDYPFLYPYPPESGKFEYKTGQTVAIMGIKNERMKQITWGLSPHLDAVRIASGDGQFLEKNNDFYVQIAALPNAGDYDLTLTSKLDDHRYDTVILLHII